ncbi:membrane protein insertase YidC [Streptomyces sp. S399]|uniref:YidC/Oxa1 family membrane protein insertase n=1 Tax=Streptomyces TaxID=1883 RepID=UPI002A7FD023|nr:membrane protein insertase YidC [Streptomyces sp. S399]WPR53062.1 membrane protein insertase YidC [Streptomyces sp. S399]WSU35895.1 YidC/Oxa1 family membrane protein insertase [Streptomyces gougerotii]
MSFFSPFADLVDGLGDVLEPVAGTASTAAAIVLFTAFVRLLVLPLSRAAARGQKARTRLAPQVAALRKKYKKNPERLRKATLELYAAEKVSPFSGVLPSLCQLPSFFLMYHLFASAEIGGAPNTLLGHSLFAAPLGDRWKDALADGGVFGAHGQVYLVLFAVVVAVAGYNYRRTKRQLAGAAAAAGPGGEAEALPGMGAMNKIAPLMSFMTLFTVGFVPLAAGLYVVTTTLWTAVERTLLHREEPAAVPAAA